MMIRLIRLGRGWPGEVSGGFGHQPALARRLAHPCPAEQVNNHRLGAATGHSEDEQGPAVGKAHGQSKQDGGTVHEQDEQIHAQVQRPGIAGAQDHANLVQAALRQDQGVGQDQRRRDVAPLVRVAPAKQQPEQTQHHGQHGDGQHAARHGITPVMPDLVNDHQHQQAGNQSRPDNIVVERHDGVAVDEHREIGQKTRAELVQRQTLGLGADARIGLAQADGADLRGNTQQAEQHQGCIQSAGKVVEHGGFSTR